MIILAIVAELTRVSVVILSRCTRERTALRRKG
jgi:hypothetical protein